MPHDPHLAELIRDALACRPGIYETKMFGGYSGFLNQEEGRHLLWRELTGRRRADRPTLPLGNHTKVSLAQPAIKVDRDNRNGFGGRDARLVGAIARNTHKWSKSSWRAGRIKNWWDSDH